MNLEFAFPDLRSTAARDGSWQSAGERLMLRRSAMMAVADAGMVRSAGLEPATYGFEVRCSIRLSYERTLTANTIVVS